MDNELDALFREHYNPLKLYIWSLCKNIHLAEDVACDAFYKALKLPSFTDGNFKYWLYKTARNRLIDLIRRKKFEGEMPEHSEPVSPENSPENELIKNERYRALYHALDLLNEAQREVLMLMYFQDMSIIEISALTGKTEANVKVLLHRGREELKKLLNT
ncbi:MAG: RNA polymerase sigma factor [Christensenellaceae bacterium]|nr:RNA polymerase sigma factor [Christensenellaceae bacterium]